VGQVEKQSFRKREQSPMENGNHLEFKEKNVKSCEKRRQSCGPHVILTTKINIGSDHPLYDETNFQVSQRILLTNNQTTKTCLII